MNRVKFDGKILLNFAFAMLGVLIMALTFNICYAPNNLVISGVSGLSIVANYISGIEPALFITIANVLLIILSIVALGFKSSIKTIIGSLAFSLFVYLTKDANTALNIHFDETLMYLIVGGVSTGLGAGLIYKNGYSSGGTDVLTLVLAKYGKIQLGKSQLTINTIVVLIGGLVFGATMIIYAIIVNYIESLVIDKVQLGFSGSKMFYIRTDHPEEVKKLITKKLHSGVTELEVTGGYSSKKQTLLMSTISTKKYIELKNKIKEIDDEAFIVISECYDVLGGTKK